MYSRGRDKFTLFRPRSSLGPNYTTIFRNRRRETTRWRIVETPQHSTWHLARMLLECSWELLQNVMAWILNYVCRAVATWRDATRRDTRKDARDRSARERGGRGLLRRHWESMPSKGQRLTRTVEAHARVIAASSFLQASSSSPDQCRSAIITLAHSKENCGTFLRYNAIINRGARIRDLLLKHTKKLVADKCGERIYWHGLSRAVAVNNRNYVHHCLIRIRTISRFF